MMRFVLTLAAVLSILAATWIPGGGFPQGLHKAAAAAGAMVDFNGDGFADLAVGVPMDRVSSVRGGAVNVLYGTAGGLSATNSQLWHQNSQGIPDSAQSNDLFGSAVATGDFNGDGFTDLAVGVPGQSVEGAANAGAVHVLFGSSDGLTAAGTQFFSQKTSEIPDRPEAGDMFGSALAAGDFNADGFHDLAVGIPGENRRTTTGAGMVLVLPGSQTGLMAAANQVWHQNSNGIFNDAEANDRFGTSLAAADFNGDGAADLAIGVPLEDLAAADAGGVHVLHGGPNGLSAATDQFWTQASRGIVDDAEAGDQFGAAMAVGDFNGDGKWDLAIGVRETFGAATAAGAVHVFYGTDAGLSATGAQFWSQNSIGVVDGAEAQDQFGAALATGDFNGDGLGDLAVGVPGESLGAIAAGGAVHILHGTANGLSATGSQLWTQDSGGILDIGEANDRFGSALAAGDFDGNAFEDLAVGVHLENHSGLDDAGAVHVIGGGTDGLTPTDNRFWHQGTSGVPGDLEGLDQFGSALAGNR